MSNFRISIFKTTFANFNLELNSLLIQNYFAKSNTLKHVYTTIHGIPTTLRINKLSAHSPKNFPVLYVLICFFIVYGTCQTLPLKYFARRLPPLT